MTNLSKDKVILDNIEFCSTELSYIYDYNTNLYSSFMTHTIEKTYMLYLLIYTKTFAFKC